MEKKQDPQDYGKWSPFSSTAQAPPTLQYLPTSRRQMGNVAASMMSAEQSRHELEHQQELTQHLRYLSIGEPARSPMSADDAAGQLKVAPVFTGGVLHAATREVFPEYGLLGSHASRSATSGGERDPKPPSTDPRLFVNTNAPSSTFICGSQGSGKSHTLSCMLENALIPSYTNRLPAPLAGIVFHYDRFVSHGSTQICEAAYLCSAGIPVRVLVSPTNQWRMRDIYENLPGLAKDVAKPQVIPMCFTEEQLDVSRMMTMMGVNKNDERAPLYVETIRRILREMAIESHGARGLDYAAFLKHVEEENFSREQQGFLKLRLDLLESFMMKSPARGKQARKKKAAAQVTWDFEAGSLTVVDLSCPFVDESAACDLFSICLQLFLEQRSKSGRIVALDEAHKFLNMSNPSASNFTEHLLQVIRQQRHLATRVIISTQEPTVSPKLLDLCNLTIVHRFTSPEWLRELAKHLAGVTGVDEEVQPGNQNIKAIFKRIVTLDTGEALLFCPNAVVSFEPAQDGSNRPNLSRPIRLGMAHIRIRVRKRITVDGGKSLMAV